MTPQHVLAQSCHSLIGQLWTNAISSGLTKPNGKGEERKIWMLWDNMIPKPDRHTAPFWLYACESAHASEPMQSSFTFVPPLSTPMQLENIPDSGIDAFMHPSLPPEKRRMAVHAGVQSRQAMGRMIKHLDTSTPVAHYKNGRLTISTAFEFDRRLSDAEKSENLWRARKELAEHIGTPIKLPTCPQRLSNIAGKHIDHITYHGLSVCGVFPEVDRDWVEGESVLVNTSISTQRLPGITPPLWFGFRVDSDGPPPAMFDWCRSYAKHREYAIECFENPARFAGYPDFTKQLREAGAVAGGKASGKQQRITNEVAATFDAGAFDLSDFL